MIIDAHCHYYPQRWYSTKVKSETALRWSKAQGRDPSECPIWQVDDNIEPDTTLWFKNQEYLGIDIGVNLVVDWGGHEGILEEPPISIEEINRKHCLAAQEHPGKLYTFCGVNPKRANAVQLVEKAVKGWGAKGVKLYPPVGFYPNDRVCYRLYEKCAELGIPVTLHMGYGVYGYMKYANPANLDEPAKDFRELEFIMAHAGGGIGFLWQEAVTVAAGNPNINLELAEVAPSVIKGGRAGKSGRYKDHIPDFLDILDIMRNRMHGGCSRILFGTDYPLYPLDCYKGWTDLFKNLPAVAAQHGYDFTQEETDMMCYKNAARIINIDISKV